MFDGEAVNAVINLGHLTGHLILAGCKRQALIILAGILHISLYGEFLVGELVVVVICCLDVYNLTRVIGSLNLLGDRNVGKLDVVKGAVIVRISNSICECDGVGTALGNGYGRGNGLAVILCFAVMVKRAVLCDSVGKDSLVIIIEILYIDNVLVSVDMLLTLGVLIGDGRECNIRAFVLNIHAVSREAVALNVETELTVGECVALEVLHYRGSRLSLSGCGTHVLGNNCRSRDSVVSLIERYGSRSRMIGDVKALCIVFNDRDRCADGKIGIGLCLVLAESDRLSLCFLLGFLDGDINIEFGVG